MLPSNFSGCMDCRLQEPECFGQHSDRSLMQKPPAGLEPVECRNDRRPQGMTNFKPMGDGVNSSASLSEHQLASQRPQSQLGPNCPGCMDCQLQEPECFGQHSDRSLMQKPPAGMEPVECGNSSRIQGMTISKPIGEGSNSSQSPWSEHQIAQKSQQNRERMSRISDWTEQLISGQANVREITQRRMHRQESCMRDDLNFALHPGFQSNIGRERKAESMRRGSKSPHRVRGEGDGGRRGVKPPDRIPARGDIGCSRSCTSTVLSGGAAENFITDVAGKHRVMENLPTLHGMADELHHEFLHRVSLLHPRVEVVAAR